MLKEIKSHKPVYLILTLLLILAFVIRIYNIDRLLGFYFDQGRDALVIWDFWHKGKLFLIGPTTGLAGIFRAPFYYYLIAPFYLIGEGNPLFPSVFLIFTSVMAIFLIYCLGAKIQDRATGIIAAILTALSFNIVMASRWLSNPTPMLLLSMILVWAMFKVSEGKDWGWPIIAVVFGLSLFSFGSAGELFYFPAILIFLIITVLRQGYGGQSSLNNKVVFISATLFILTFLPLVIFDIKHDGILRNNILNTFVGEKSFTLPSLSLFESRNKSYYDIFSTKLFHIRGKKEIMALWGLLLSFILFLPGFIKNKKIKIILLLLISPLIGLYFYQGNHMVLYDYYMTGYYLIFILLVAVVLGKIWSYKLGMIVVIYFIYLFIANNLNVLNYKLNDKSNSPGSVALVNQLESVDWVISSAEAKGEIFNVDVYVPPVISYSYDYLFLWQTTLRCGNSLCGMKRDENVKNLYTLYEKDSTNPDRLQAWMDRQDGIGKVFKETSFGGIVVQKRERIMNDK
ncbi:MAG: glycosyltransferase family 39 protein [bacterium]|nr:glycosyltransferase family 39 protein [bacterium]